MSIEKHIPFVAVDKNRINFNPMAMPGCQWCGAIEVATSPEGRQYTRPPFGCCMVRVVHKASVAASYLADHENPPPWLNKKGRQDELREWRITKAEFESEYRRAYDIIEHWIATSENKKGDLEAIASYLGQNKYKVSILQRLQRRYGDG